jgi:hypothetical protein
LELVLLVTVEDAALEDEVTEPLEVTDDAAIVVLLEPL